MSWLKDLVPDQEKANAAAALTFTDAPPAPGAFANLSESFKGIPKGLIDAADTADAVLSKAGAAIEDLAGIEPIPGSMGDRAASDRAAAPVRAMYRREYAIDPQTTGFATQIIYEANKILPRTVVGGMVAGPVGAGVAAGAPEGYATTQDAVADGIDENTALKLGVVRGATTGVGAMLPGSGLAKGMAADLGLTVGANVGLGALDRYSTSRILANNGYTAQAAQYEVFDGTAMATDAVLGTLFFAAARATSPVQADAALTLKAQQAARPDDLIPTNPRSAKQSLSASDEALRRLLAGERVDLAEALTEAEFIRPARPVQTDLPLTDGPTADVIAAAVDRTIGLESAGVADARNSNSSATGLGQFIEPTWLDVVGRNRPDLLEGRTRDEVLALRTDPVIAREITTRFTEENANALGRAGVRVDEQTLYMAHHFGAGGAVKMLRADPARPVSEFLTAKEMKANPHLKGKTIAQAMDDFERRAGRTPRPRMATPDEVAATAFAEKARKYGVEEEAIIELTPTVPRDSVTGFVDGRTNQVKSSAVMRAQEFVAETGQPAHYVSADIFNLGGLNKAMNDSAEAANAHYRAMAEIMAEELRVTGADVIPMRTGGDEFGAVVAGIDSQALQAAVMRTEARVAEYTREQGLSDIPNPKRKKELGVGLHMGAARITPGESIRAILDHADAGVNVSKNGGSRVLRKQTRKAGADAPGGQARGAAGRAATPAAGIRQPSGRGAGADPDSAGVAVAERPEGRVKPDEGVTAEPSPPPDVVEAQRLVDEAPEQMVLDGFDSDGSPIYRPMAEALAEIEADRQVAVRESEGFQAAVSCFLRRG